MGRQDYGLGGVYEFAELWADRTMGWVYVRAGWESLSQLLYLVTSSQAVSRWPSHTQLVTWRSDTPLTDGISFSLVNNR